MSKDQVGFFLNFLLLTLALTFAIDYFFPSKPIGEVLSEGRLPTELAEQPTPPKNLYEFSTSNQSVFIDKDTGNIEKITLKNYFDKDKNPIATLFEKSEDNTGHQSFRTGLIVKQFNSKTKTDEPAELTFSQVDITESEGSLIVSRTSDSDITFIQKYTPSKNYAFDIKETIINNSEQELEAYSFTQLENTHQALQPGTIPGFYMFQGASFHTDNTKYNKIPFSKYKKSKFNEFSKEGWYAFSQRYFVTAVSPQYPGTYYSKHLTHSDEAIAGHLSQVKNIASGQSTVDNISIYSGPEKVSYLTDFAPKLDMVIDYGMLWPIAKVFFYLLTFIHQFVHNWGVAIILTTFVMKIVFLYHSQKSFIAMEKVKALQPQLEKIKEQHKEDQQMFYQEMTKLYSTHKVSPMSGILLNFIQIPFFIAFYSVLMESIELRGASFGWWITDLSLKDPFYVLPVLMGAIMFIQQYLSPPPQDETMAFVMRLLPVIFTFFFLQFPSGLVLYWLSNTIFTVIHMGIMKSAFARNTSG